MGTDFNQILARKDYVKVTKSLRENCDQLESAISEKMVELELSGRNGGIVVNNMSLFSIKGYLFIRTPEKDSINELYYDCAEYRQIYSEKGDEESIVDDEGGRHFVFYPCSNKHALEFIKNAAAIIEELGKIEQKKVEIIQKAIKDK